MTFSERLTSAMQEKNTRLCVGLDPRLELLPSFLLESAQKKYGDGIDSAAKALIDFDRAVIDAVSEHVAAIKFQSAFYEQYGPAGMQALLEGIQYAKSKNIVVILDAKRGDIDSTALAYASAFLGRTVIFGKEHGMYDVDSLTINPFLGTDTIKPFLSTAEKYKKGVFILVKTSNPGSSDFQGVIGDGNSVSERIASFIHEQGRLSLDSNGYSSIGAVVGATFANDAIVLRQMMPHSIFLVPGIGAQGGSIENIKHFFDSAGFGALINSSRSVVFSFEKKNERSFQSVIAQHARQLKEQINTAVKKN